MRSAIAWTCGVVASCLLPAAADLAKQLLGKTSWTRGLCVNRAGGVLVTLTDGRVLCFGSSATFKRASE